MTPKIIEYQIVRIAPGYHSCPEIAAEIKRGWQPFGQPFIHMNKEYFMQAMVKYEEPAPPPSFHETLLRSFERDLAEGRVAPEYKEAVRAFMEQRRKP